MNIFLDYEIVLKSSPISLKNELDILVQLKNEIFVWSKTIHPLIMRKYCLSKTFENKEEKEKHKQILELRSHNKPYKEISDIVNIPIDKIGFYISTDINKIWSLDDWIKDYLVKDSSIYQKVDFIIDPDLKLVERFKSKGIDGNCINAIK